MFNLPKGHDKGDEVSIENGNYIIQKPWAETTEHKDMVPDNDNVLRVYCAQRGSNDKDGKPDNWYKFQIRTHKPTRRGGVKRNMLASVDLSVRQLRAIMDWVESQQKES